MSPGFASPITGGMTVAGWWDWEGTSAYTTNYIIVSGRDCESDSNAEPIPDSNYAERWFESEWELPRVLESQCHTRRWFEHCRKRNGKDRLTLTL